MNRDSLPRGFARRQHGATMIEVMVAVLVLSVGLLGTAALLGVTVRNTQSANYRSQAVNLAYEYIDSARSNRNNIGPLLLPNWSSAVCEVTADPAYAGNCGNNSPVLDCDRRRFSERVCRTLPGGRARVIPLDVANNRIQVRVDICWNDDRSVDAQVTAACTSDSETLFSVVAEI
jgi:type IV pilus assembly protein PilV